MARPVRKLGCIEAGAALCLFVTFALAQNALPDPATTPGAINPAVTQATIGETICQRGWTRTVRPAEAFTDAMKRAQLRAAGYPGRLRSFEEDHLIPLELGGAPADRRNLWLEPRRATDGWRAAQKDDLERVLNRMVCHGQVTLREAQSEITKDWTASYQRLVGR